VSNKVSEVLEHILSIIGFDNFVLNKLVEVLSKSDVDPLLNLIHYLISLYTPHVKIWKSCVIFTYRDRKYAVCKDVNDVENLVNEGVIDEGVDVTTIVPILVKKIIERTLSFVNILIDDNKSLREVLSELTMFSRKFYISYKAFEKIYSRLEVGREDLFKKGKRKLEVWLHQELKDLMKFICVDILSIPTLEKCIAFMTWYIAREISEDLNKRMSIVKEVKGEVEKSGEAMKLKLY